MHPAQKHIHDQVSPLSPAPVFANKVCTLSDHDGNPCRRIFWGPRRYRDIVQHISIHHPESYIPGLPETVGSVWKMLNRRFIKCLIISDTLENDIPDIDHTEKIDVVIHCGNMTMRGGPDQYRKVLAQIQTIQAELKLVIPGTYDVLLDPRQECRGSRDPGSTSPILNIFDPEKRAARGVHLLDNGTHRFRLRNGRSFTVFASPFAKSCPGNVDILITHGPPRPPASFRYIDGYKLDWNGADHLGCTHLFEALRCNRPQLHCFGHVHEGFGTQMVAWSGADGQFEIDKVRRDREVRKTEAGKTLLVNAAIRGDGLGLNLPSNRAIVVEVLLGTRNESLGRLLLEANT